MIIPENLIAKPATAKSYSSSAQSEINRANIFQQNSYFNLVEISAEQRAENLSIIRHTIHDAIYLETYKYLQLWMI
ncbi:hypothetical protein WN51_02332 [Melipona quadrifasciata]|uniref:Uncharacterized protein n=1 Tax=Melipona quadrifasciata TaxID=166423 RepID=A0A0N0BEE5_9HYME|nr:hypothetical protein WN51_02332 [Melipona quadrifasciata]